MSNAARKSAGVITHRWPILRPGQILSRKYRFTWFSDTIRVPSAQVSCATTSATDIGLRSSVIGHRQNVESNETVWGRVPGNNPFSVARHRWQHFTAEEDRVIQDGDLATDQVRVAGAWNQYESDRATTSCCARIPDFHLGPI